LKSNYSLPEKLDHTYLFADLVRLAIMDISSKIICKDTSIILLFHAGISVISSPSFARNATSSNLNSPTANLDNNNEMSSSNLEPFLLCFANLHLMSSMLNQLIRWEANFVDLGKAPTKSCWVVFTIKDDDKKDDGEPSNDFKELVAISVEAGDPTDVVGEEGELFLKDSNKKIGS
jgi:hypothetical protein